MERIFELWQKAKHLFRRRKWDDELEEEMRLHLELRAAEAAERGIPGREAEAHARRRFGNVTGLREQSREAWGWRWLDTLAQDIRYGVRTLAGEPGFTLCAVLSLALGIGANTAIFSLVNAVMLRALPVEEPGSLVQLQGGNNKFFTNPIWEQVRNHQRAFRDVLAYSNNRFDLSDGGESRYADGLWVSGSYFRMLGVPALRGRIIEPDDDRHGCGAHGPVAVISYAFWQSNFGGDPAIVGKAVRLDRHPFQIIGVTPPWFRGLDVDQMYSVAIPIGCEPLLHTDQSALNHRSWWWLRIIGRIKPGESLAQAADKLNSIAPEVYRATLPANWLPRMQKQYREQRFSLSAASTGVSQTAARYRTALFTLMGVVGLVLLIACANIANLLLARGAMRHREISVRLALGASRRRVVRQLLTESLLLSVFGACLGFLFSAWGSRLLVRMLSTSSIKMELDLRPDLHVLGFTAAVAIGTAILFGFAPALRSTSFGPHQVLKEQPRGAMGVRSRSAVANLIVGCQIGLSLVLLVGAGLFLGTLRNLLTLDPGFNRHQVLLMKTAVPAAKVQKAARPALFLDVLARLRAIPGVESAACSMLTPVSHTMWNDVVHPEGYQPKSEFDTLVYFNRISAGYFATMGTPLLVGRDFSDRDTLAAPKVVVLAESTARHFWGTESPIGKTIEMDVIGERGKRESYRVVGVVKDAKYGDLNERPLMTAYVTTLQDSDAMPQISYEIRFNGSMEALTSAARRVVGAVNKDASVEFRSFEAQINDSLMQQRVLAFLTAFFGGLALLLAMVGLYGVVSYSVAKRRGEIGIRMALGAERRAVMRLILRDVLLMLAIGTVVGLVAALGSARLVTSMLFGVRPADPFTLTLAILILVLSAGLAGYLPARRAAGMNPMAALRDE